MTVFVVPPNNIYDGIQLRDGDELLVKEGGVIVDTTILLGGSEEIFAGKSEGTEIADGEEELLGGESVNPNEFPVAELHDHHHGRISGGRGSCYQHKDHPRHIRT